MSSFKKKKFDDEKIEVDLKSSEAENDVKSDKDSKKKKEKVYTKVPLFSSNKHLVE